MFGLAAALVLERSGTGRCLGWADLLLSDAAAELVVLLFEGLDELFVDLGQSADLAVFLGVEVAVVAADWGLDWGLVVLVVSDHPVHYNFIDFMIHPSPPYHHPIQNNQMM